MSSPASPQALLWTLLLLGSKVLSYRCFMKNVQYVLFFPFIPLMLDFKRLSLGHMLEHNVLWIFSSSY